MPAIILLYKIYFFDELKPGWARNNAKWMIALMVFYIMTAALALRPAMLSQLHLDFARSPVTPWNKFLFAPWSLFCYLYLIFFPFPQFLSLNHELPFSVGWLHPFTIVVSWPAFLGVVVLALIQARRWKVFSFAVLWYLGSLAVESMPLPVELIYEHRLYLALLGVLVPACAWPVLKGKSLRLALAWGIVIALFFGFFAFIRNRVWAGAPLWRKMSFKNTRDMCMLLIRSGLSIWTKAKLTSPSGISIKRLKSIQKTSMPTMIVDLLTTQKAKLISPFRIGIRPLNWILKMRTLTIIAG